MVTCPCKMVRYPQKMTKYPWKVVKCLHMFIYLIQHKVCSSETESTVITTRVRALRWLAGFSYLLHTKNKTQQNVVKSTYNKTMWRLLKASAGVPVIASCCMVILVGKTKVQLVRTWDSAVEHCSKPTANMYNSCLSILTGWILSLPSKISAQQEVIKGTPSDYRQRSVKSNNR